MTDTVVIFTHELGRRGEASCGACSKRTAFRSLMSAEALRAIFPAPATAQGDVRLVRAGRATPTRRGR